MYLSNDDYDLKVTRLDEKFFRLARHASLFKYSFKQHGTEIALTGIRKHDDDVLALHFRFFRHADSGGHRGPARNAGEQSLFLRQPAGHLNRFFICDLLHTVYHGKVKDIGDEACAKALNFMRSRPEFLAL